MEKLKPAEIIALQAAKDLISDPRKWVKGDFAQTQTGYPVKVTDPFAYSFCAVGATLRAIWAMNLHRVERGKDRILFSPIMNCLTDATPPNNFRSLQAFNDNPKTTHKDIMNLFSKVIRNSEKTKKKKKKSLKKKKK